jgi:cell division protein FtsB
MNVDLGIWDKLSRLVIFLLAAAAVLTVILCYRPLIDTNERYRKRIMALEAEVQREEQENRRLETLVSALQRDKRTVERVTREQLNMSAPGEVVFRFEPPAAPAGR